MRNSLSFEDSDNVLNLVTKAVLPDKSEKDVLERDKEGEAMFATFSTEWLAGKEHLGDVQEKSSDILILFKNHEDKVERQDHPAERKEFNNTIHNCW